MNQQEQTSGYGFVYPCHHLIKKRPSAERLPFSFQAYSHALTVVKCENFTVVTSQLL